MSWQPIWASLSIQWEGGQRSSQDRGRRGADEARQFAEKCWEFQSELTFRAPLLSRLLMPIPEWGMLSWIQFEISVFSWLYACPLMFRSICIWGFYVQSNLLCFGHYVYGYSMFSWTLQGFGGFRCSSCWLIYVGMGNLSKLSGVGNKNRAEIFWEAVSFWLTRSISDL